jgi:hypothetical protein
MHTGSQAQEQWHCMCQAGLVPMIHCMLALSKHCSNIHLPAHMAVLGIQGGRHTPSSPKVHLLLTHNTRSGAAPLEEPCGIPLFQHLCVATLVALHAMPLRGGSQGITRRHHQQSRAMAQGGGCCAGRSSRATHARTTVGNLAAAAKQLRVRGGALPYPPLAPVSLDAC